MILHRVQILGGGGEHAEKHVMAKNPKKALLAVIESLPEDHPLWQAPGWRDVQIYPETRAFIVRGFAP